MTETLAEFSALHGPVLARDEMRHNMLLAILDSESGSVATWTLGPAGACAVQAGHHHIVLGAVDEAAAHRLAEATASRPYPGITGPGLTAQWFVDRARKLSLSFAAPMRLTLHVLDGRARLPATPATPGRPRVAGFGDARLVISWVHAFMAEAVPGEAPPRDDAIELDIACERYLLWEVDRKAVAIGAMQRETQNTGIVTCVYTEPAERARGYGGSVTAALAERAFANGKSHVCLFVDRGNAAAARCYARLGFKPHVDALAYRRDP
ncbi:MAG: GNAT family N-acetyltransferase [Alphaproteobacteria bacterium]|nr:GNAT family N-acetyltransferase [Alphaproteobacteria bacterium]MCZ6763443.1 GNAT family N-acetyltransferase [Alphaproteobacteria bacterium]